jgi:multisubunit Na+/H+ antiporter MnhB subunit
MMELAFDALLSLLLLCVGAWSIVARRTGTAVIAFIVYGLLLSLAWLRIAAVDVALTEAAIGSGATGMLLIMAAYRTGTDSASERIQGPAFRSAVAVLSILLVLGLVSLSFLLPGEAASLAGQVMEHLPESGLGNPVAGVLFVYRAFDTLLEKIVLLMALLGVWSLARDSAWGGVPGLKPFWQRHSVLLLLARTLPPIGLVYGIYMTWVGADLPGGAFQGGTVLAAMWVLAMLAGVSHTPALSSMALRLMLVLGPVAFLVIGLWGFVSPGTFLAYPEGSAKPLIVVMEFALTISIGGILGLLIAGPPEGEGSA